MISRQSSHEQLLVPGLYENDARGFRGGRTVALSIVVIVGGVLSIACNFVNFVMECNLMDLGDWKSTHKTGFYCGTVLVITGSFGIAVAKRNLANLIAVFTVLSIFSASACALQVVFSTVDLIMHSRVDSEGVDEYQIAFRMNCLMLIAALVCGFVAVHSSVVGCMLICSKNAETLSDTIPTITTCSGDNSASTSHYSGSLRPPELLAVAPPAYSYTAATAELRCE